MPSPRCDTTSSSEGGSSTPTLPPEDRSTPRLDSASPSAQAAPQRCAYETSAPPSWSAAAPGQRRACCSTISGTVLRCSEQTVATASSHSPAATDGAAKFRTDACGPAGSCAAAESVTT